MHVALRVYLCMMTSNCSGERSFSKLKRIKSEPRNSIGESRLSFLSLMSIEHEVLLSLDFGDIIKEFAMRKARKRPF